MKKSPLDFSEEFYKTNPVTFHPDYPVPHLGQLFEQAMQQARDEALEDAEDVVQQARSGEIDGDFRSIISRINGLRALKGKP